MVSKYIKIIILTLASTLFFNTLSYARTFESWPNYEEEIASDSAFVIDSGSGVVLYEKNADEKMYPASITKIMTALVVIDKIKNYDEQVFFSYNACTNGIDKNSTTIGAQAGDKLSVKECLYAILLPSANDAANALAEHVAGNISDFVKLMNEKAKMLKMNNTHFTNPSGLQDEDHYSTSHDLGILLSEAIKEPFFIEISSSLSFTHAPIRRYKNPKNSNNTMLNTNSMILTGNKYYYKYTTSGKTGHTKDAGYCLASSAKKDGMNLVCVTLNSKGFNDRFIDAKNLFEFYFKEYKSLAITDFDNRFDGNYSDMSIANVDLIKSISLTCDENSHITLPKDVSEKNVTSKVFFQIRENSRKDAIGCIEYYFKDNKIGECEIIGENLKINPINVQNLDISSIDNTTFEDVKPLQIKKYVNKDRLFYYDELNKLTLSKGFTRLLIALLIISIIVIISRFAYTKTYISFSESLDFLYTRIRGRFNRKRRRR